MEVLRCDANCFRFGLMISCHIDVKCLNFDWFGWWISYGQIFFLFLFQFSQIQFVFNSHFQDQFSKLVLLKNSSPPMVKLESPFIDEGRGQLLSTPPHLLSTRPHVDIYVPKLLQMEEKSGYGNKVRRQESWQVVHLFKSLKTVEMGRAAWVAWIKQRPLMHHMLFHALNFSFFIPMNSPWFSKIINCPSIYRIILLIWLSYPLNSSTNFHFRNWVWGVPLFFFLQPLFHPYLFSSSSNFQKKSPQSFSILH